MSQSQGGMTGPQGGRATGQRDRGVDEPTTSRRDKISSRRLGPGSMVGVFTTDGPSLTGEVNIEKSREVVEAVHELSREIEKEPLPPEYREQVERFHELLMEGDPAEK